MMESDTDHVHAQHRHGSDHDDAHHGHHHAPATPGTVTDPVCGMAVAPTRSAHRAEHEGHTFHFCSARCREKFIAAPAAYVGENKAAGSAEAPMPKGTIYTCPMHPQIRQE